MIPADFKPPIHRHETLESTNKTAKEMARKGAPEGSVIIARTQTQGRGRGKRVWHSPEGGLYLSVLLFPKEARRLTDLSILAGVALAQAVKTLLPKSKDISVKWPNDCLVGWKKVGGILCESAGDDSYPVCVVGMGLNVNVNDSELSPYKTNPFSATSFIAESEGGKYDMENVTSVLLRKLFTVYHLYQEQGFEPIQFLWEKNCKFIGKRIELREPSGAGGAAIIPGVAEKKAEVMVGTVLGIDGLGGLVLSNSKGDRHSYFSGEITCFWP